MKSELVQMDNKPSERIGVFDSIRGFSMFLVVFGHVLMSFNLGGYSSFLGSVITTFRMPLFFFVSGFCAYRAVDKWTGSLCRRVLEQKVKAQIICTLFFFALFAYVMGCNPVGWIDNGFGGYWFTIVLFQMFAVYLVLNVVSRAIKYPIVDIAMVLIAVICLYILIYQRPGDDNRLWVVLCGENLTKYFQFFVLGLFARKYYAKFCALLSREWFKASMLIGFVVFMCLYYNDTFKQYGMLYQMVHDIIVRYVGLLMVVSLFFAYKEYFESDNAVSRSLRFVGRRTLDIYMMHYFFLPVLPWSMEWLSGHTMTAVQIFVCTIVTLTIIAICLLLSQATRTSRTLSVWLWGMRKK